MTIQGNEYVDWSNCLQGGSRCLLLNAGPSVRSCHSCNMCNGIWRNGCAPCSGVNVQLPSLLSSFRAGLATQSKWEPTVQARGWGEHWIILIHGDFAAEIVREAKDTVRWQNHEDNFPSRKSCKHLNEKELWTTQVCCIFPLCQGSPNNFWVSESFIQNTQPSRDQWCKLNSQIQDGSVIFLSFSPANDRVFIPSWFPAVPKQAEPCQT